MSKNITSIVGIIFLLIGIILNEWVFAALFKISGGIVFPLERIALWGFSLFFVTAGFIFLCCKKAIGNFLLVLFSIGLTYFAADVVMSRQKHMELTGQKTYVQLGDQWGNCYPFVEGSHLPIERIDPNTNTLANCVIYDVEKRKEGYYPSRSSKVAVIGDSFTFGEGVKDTDTLGYLLGKQFPAHNFLNFGQSGADIMLVYKVLNYLLDERKDVKHITYFYNINDVLMSPELAREQKFIIDFQNVQWSNEKKSTSVVSEVLSKSAIYRLLNRTLILKKESALTVKNYLEMYDPAFNKEELDKTIMLLSAMHKKAKQHNVAFSVVMYPLLHKDRFGLYPFKPIHQLMYGICKQYGIPFVDAYHAFDSYGSLKDFIVHPLDYHPNGKANVLVVDYLKKVPVTF